MYWTWSRRYSLADDAATVRRRRYGMIEVQAGELTGIRFRWWPKMISGMEAGLWGMWRHRWHSDDVCRLYYKQPWGSERYLALCYVTSEWGTTFASFRRAVRALDEVAEIKGSDGIVCDVTNARISDRLLARWGWERHLEGRRGRHFIKRFGRGGRETPVLSLTAAPVEAGSAL